MTYCGGAPKATITYKFGSGSERTYIADRTPITVDASDRYTPPFAAGQCPITYWVDFNFTYRFDRAPNALVRWYFDGQANSIPIYGKILDIYTDGIIGQSFGGNNSVRGATIVYLDYRFGTVRNAGLTPTTRVPASDSYPYNDGWSLYAWQITSIRPTSGQADNCGDPQPVCSLKVLSNGQQIFIDRGDCPVTYSVVCGEECPPDTLKCSKPGYPGYYCLPCPPLVSDLKVIANQIRRINNG